jgi:hypothetical protein
MSVTAAGLRRRVKTEGTVVGVYDGHAAALDTDSGRWQTVCERHGEVCSHTTLTRALAFARVPTEWCEHCAAETFDPESADVYAALLRVAYGALGAYVTRLSRDEYEVDYDALCQTAADEQGWGPDKLVALWRANAVRRRIEEALVAHITSGQAAYDAYAGTLARG